MRNTRKALSISAALFGLAFIATVPAAADQVILDDLIVDGSACIGQDCVNGESFGFDTIRIKENNLRIKAQDTSSTASFPSNDWQITFNESSNGGANKFSIDDIDGGRTPFTLEAGAPSHSLYVDDGGRLGFGTSAPVVELHVVDGDTPTLRLEQDGSSGFTPQTWDVAGNETNFFIRDVTNGSKLPLRIRPNSATSSIDVQTGGVGINTSSPDAQLHVNVSGSGTGFTTVSKFEANDRPRFEFEQRLSGNARTWTVGVAGAGAAYGIAMDSDIGVNEFVLEAGTGNLTIGGTLTTAGDVYPDYVFEPGYRLMPIDELETFIDENGHLPNVSKSEDVDGGRRINISALGVQLLEKVEELTLYTIAQQREIAELRAQLGELEERQ